MGEKLAAIYEAEHEEDNKSNRNIPYKQLPSSPDPEQFQTLSKVSQQPEGTYHVAAEDTKPFIIACVENLQMSALTVTTPRCDLIVKDIPLSDFREGDDHSVIRILYIMTGSTVHV